MAQLGSSSYIHYEPKGVVLIISPWNYPFYQAIVPITLAFVVGNAIIYKPSSATPLKGLVEELLEEAGYGEADNSAVIKAYGALSRDASDS